MNRLLSLLLLALLATPAAAAQEEPGKLKINDLIVGTGAEVERHSTVSVHYTGWLMDGTKFDSSLDRGTPFTFTVGAGRVIPGWDEGLEGMKAGGKRELVIPPDLAYGARGVGDVIPPNATLRFEIQLIKASAPAYDNIGNAKLRNLLTRGVPIVDLRTAPEWKETGIVAGSKLITAFDEKRKFVRSFPSDLETVARADEEIILICRTGNRTAVISRLLSEQLGYKKIYNVEKGITHWIAEGNPVTKPVLN